MNQMLCHFQKVLLFEVRMCIKKKKAVESGDNGDQRGRQQKAVDVPLARRLVQHLLGPTPNRAQWAARVAVLTD